MNSFEFIAPLITGVGMASFAVIFTLLYRTYANSAIAEYESGQCDVDLIEETIVNNRKEAKSSRKIWKKVKNILFAALIIMLIPFLLFAVYSKITNGVAMIGGKGVIAVASGSMSQKNAENAYLANINNQFNTYDMITLEKVDSPADLQIYDVIAFVNDKGVNVIHRIVGFQNTPEGLRYVTRGDSNNADDDYKPSFNDVLGEYTGGRVPYVGVFAMFLQSYSGIITVIAVIYCLFMIEIIGNKIYLSREKRLNFLLESIDFKTETSADGGVDSKFIETVYFQNYIYTFDENGLISQTPMDEHSENAQNLNSVPPTDLGTADDTAGDDDGEKS